jgi:hypothetical protein
VFAGRREGVSIKLGVSFKRYGAISGRVRKVEVVMENRGHGEGCYERVEMEVIT